MSSSSLPQFNPLTPIQDSINDHIDLYFPPQQTQSLPIFVDYMPNQPFSSFSSRPESVVMNEKLAFNKHQSIPYPTQDTYHLMNQNSLSKNKLSILGDLVNHDWEAVRYFLRSQVRCGGDVSRVYKCNFCSHEFPNAQAFGGHMSSHSKTKKSSSKKSTIRARKGALKFCPGNGKKSKVTRGMVKDSLKERIESEESVKDEIVEERSKMARGMVKDSLKERLESEESMNGEIVEETDEEWFKYLNFDVE